MLKRGHRSSAAGSVTLLWRGERVADIDLSGATHTDAAPAAGCQPRITGG